MTIRSDEIWAQLELFTAFPEGGVPLYRSLSSHLFNYSCVELTTFGVPLSGHLLRLRKVMAFLTV